MTLTRHGVLYQIKSEAQLYSWLRILNQSQARTITTPPTFVAKLRAENVVPSYPLPLIISAAA